MERVRFALFSIISLHDDLRKKYLMTIMQINVHFIANSCLISDQALIKIHGTNIDSKLVSI